MRATVSDHPNYGEQELRDRTSAGQQPRLWEVRSLFREVDRLRQENAMLRQVLAMTDPCIHQEVDNARQAHDDGRTITLEQYMADRGLQ